MLAVAVATLLGANASPVTGAHSVVVVNRTESAGAGIVSLQLAVTTTL